MSTTSTSSTLHERSTDALNGIKSNSSISSNVITTSTSTSSQPTKAVSTSATTTADKVDSTSSGAGGALPKTNGMNGGFYQEPHEELKIIGHLKSIEKINEKRRAFLTNTITESSTEANGTASLNGKASDSDVVYIYNDRSMQILEEQLMDSAASYGGTEPLQTPLTPPPKPPMLNRTRSIGLANSRTTTPTSPMQEALSLPTDQPPRAPQTMAATSETAKPQVITATITTAIVPQPPDQATTVAVQAQTPILRRSEPHATRPMSVSPSGGVVPKQISANHYDRLIEELRCPGCAMPMKAPILLCISGHSVCEQCTRILLMCPLCKEPFTCQRSLTVEALCSKAHFRCQNAPGGCTVRLQIDLLGWHERQCIYKPMKCFMGRVWGDCQWNGREAYWKDHLESMHAGKVFHRDSVDLIWNMGVKQKPLTGYYVFQVFNEMFNFYEVFDKERILFTMACTSTVKERKHYFAFEVTMVHVHNEALGITQKYPVHSEYDGDILLDGTCVSILLSDLAKFIDEDRLLHYRVRIVEVKTPRKCKPSNYNSPKNSGIHPIDFQQTQIEGVNLKNVPSEVIVTRRQRPTDLRFVDSSSPSIETATPSDPALAITSSEEDELDKMRRLYDAKRTGSPQNQSGSESDPEFDAFIAKKWGTPQMHFNRKYLKNVSNGSSSSSGDAISQYKNGHDADTLNRKHRNRKLMADDVSVSSTSTSYKKRMTNTLRKSFRTLKTDIIEMKPFGKKSPEKKIELK